MKKLIVIQSSLALLAVVLINVARYLGNLEVEEQIAEFGRYTENIILNYARAEAGIACAIIGLFCGIVAFHITPLLLVYPEKEELL